ncbi:MAG: glycosyltransferase family 2 protein [Fusobacteriaceae bacterium]
MLVSIITVSFNSEKTIKKTIESVLNQGYSEIEYILVDGNSKDSTVEIIKSYEKDFLNKGYKFKYVSEKDDGIYDAMNKGISMATGILVGIINSDDWYELDAVQNNVDEYKKEKFNVSFGNLRVISPKTTFIKKARSNFYYTTAGFTHPTMFVEKEIYIKENKYILKNIFDDLDFILRIKNKKYKIKIINKVISNFAFGGVSTKKSMKEVFETIKMTSEVYTRNGYSKIHYIDIFIIKILKYFVGQ